MPYLDLTPMTTEQTIKWYAEMAGITEDQARAVLGKLAEALDVAVPRRAQPSS